MSEECTHDCSSCASGCESAGTQSLIENLNPASSVKKVIGVVSGKGGVGKSLVTSMLAVLMQRKGFNAAILDADVTGPSIPKAFGLKDKAFADNRGLIPARTKTGIDVMSINLLLENETDPVVWRGPIIAGTVKQFWTDVIWENIDFMFVDMPPGTGDVALTTFQSLPVDALVIVTSPQELVSMIVQKAVNMASMMNIPILAAVENMSYFECDNCKKKHYIYGKSNIEDTAKAHGIPLCASIPIDPKLAAGIDAGLIELFDGNWLDSIADAVEKML